MDESRGVRMCAHIEDVETALETARRVVATAMADRRIDDEEQADINEALGRCGQRVRVVTIDGQHVCGAIAMIGTLTRTLELTPKVCRKLHEQERDLLRIESDAENALGGIAA